MSDILKVSPENEAVIKEFIDDYRGPLNVSKKTIKIDIYALRKLSDFLNKPLKEADTKDLKRFFKAYKENPSYNLFGNKFILFYRWLEDLDTDEKPKRMKFFKNHKKKEKDSIQIKEEMITKKEYQTILKNCGRDRFGMWEALFETYWLSGARRSEMPEMRIKHVTFKNGTCTIYIPKSKTKSREVPLSEYPFLLERYINNHPDKNNKDAYLWLSNANNHLGEPLKESSIGTKFWKIREKTDIKKGLTVHNFRKTRFTIMSNLRSKDGGLIYNDKQLGLLFGWSPKEVAARRSEYDLTSVEELKNVIFGNIEDEIQDYDTVKSENKKLKKDYEDKIKSLEEQMINLMKKAEEREEKMHDTISYLGKELDELKGKKNNKSTKDMEFSWTVADENNPEEMYNDFMEE